MTHPYKRPSPTWPILYFTNIHLLLCCEPYRHINTPPLFRFCSCLCFVVSTSDMKNKRASKRDKKEIKVTYISSPVKVKTSASNFRALVQELTGQYSNVAETSMPMEEENGHSERVHKTHDHESEIQQWRVDLEGTNFVKPEYNEFFSRSLVEPFNQQLLQYDLMSFDMS